MKKLIFVNKFGPLSNAVTGKNAKELADFLVNDNIEVTFVCMKADYKVSSNSSDNSGNAYTIKELRNYYSGNSPVIRLLVSLVDGFRLWLTSVTRKSDAVIVMTDPPLLFFWFQLFRSFSKRKLYYWTMDLYPEAFVAGKFIKAGNLFYKFLHKIVYSKAPDFAIILGNKQLEFLEDKFNSSLPNVIIPCGVIETNGVRDCNGIKDNKSMITFGYGGNVGEAHDAEFLVSFINQLDPEKHEILLSLYGSKANYVKQLAQGKKNVIFKEFLSYPDISCIDINIATLLSDWDHICVPSKAVTAICCGSALLLNTTREADAWNMFKEGSWLIETGKDYDLLIKEYLDGLDQASINGKRLMAKGLAKNEISRKMESLKKFASMVHSQV
ncbi:MAG: hypothetical protein WKF70_13100 [Chitinophagaceae bacterium]